MSWPCCSSVLSIRAVRLVVALLCGVLVGLTALQPSPARGVGVPVRLDWGRPKAPLPTPRVNLGAVAAANGRLYAIGGNNGSIVGTVEEYDPATNTWVRRASLSTARAGLGLATAPNGRLYAIGGFGVQAMAEEYDPVANAWAIPPVLSRLPAPRQVVSAAAANNGRLYVFGGLDGAGATKNDVFEYTPGTGAWRSVAPMPTARWGPAAALAPNGKIYVVGGYDGHNAVGTVEEYDPATNSDWRQVPAMPTARAGLGLALAGDGRLFAVGGQTASSTDTPVVEAFTPPAAPPGIGTWSTDLAPLPGPRYEVGLIGAPNGNLFAIGGTEVGGVRAETYEYDLAANAWSTQNNQPSRAPLATPRRAHAVALVGQSLFAIGGINAGGVLDSVERAVLTQLPSVSAGGPYTVATGQSVQLQGAGSDPEGSGLSFAWDLDNDLLYETAGQTPTFSAAGLPAGTMRTVRVRASDALGAYGLAQTTVTVVAVPTKLDFQTQPGGAVAGARLAPQPVVRALDPNGALVPSFGGPVTVALGANPGGATLGGTTTVNAVKGVATFTDLTVSAAGSGYTLVASAGGLTSATSAPFGVTTPPPCSPRPNVRIQTARLGAGQLQALVKAQTNAGTATNSLVSVRIISTDNAAVQVNGRPVTAGQTVSLPGGSQPTTLLLSRVSPGQASTVAFAVTDGCGEWRTFVGGGPSAF